MKKSIKSLIINIVTLMLIFAMWPAVALADDETGMTDDWFWHVLGEGTLEITGNTYATGDMAIPASLDCGPDLGVRTVTRVADNAFYITDLTGIVIPSSVTSIGSGAFARCANLISVSLPSTLKEIGSGAFAEDVFTSIDIPDSVTSIGDEAFSGCQQLTGIDLPSALTYLGHDAFYNTAITSVTIPSGITTIAYRTFAWCKHLSSITLPNTLTAIEHDAFNQTAITSITIPEGVTSIGYEAFRLCGSLSSVTLPTSLTTLEHGAFRQSAIASITIPSGVTNIDYFTFLGCTHLTSVTIPATVASIGDNAFYYCTSLSRVIILNDSIAFGTTPFASTALSSDGFYGHVDSSAQNYAGDNSILFHLLLELSPSPADGKIYTGGRISITPNVEGGTWDFDGTLLSRDGNEFTGLKAGSAHVTYTAGWQTESFEVVIQQSNLPSTGQDFSAFYWLTAITVLIGGTSVYIGAIRRKRGQA